MRSFATRRPAPSDVEGPEADSAALRLLLHLQSFAGHPHPGQTLPMPVE
jgi:hypothetical protein